MATEDQLASWAQTALLLRGAKACLTQANMQLHAKHLEDVEHFLDHNELGLAFDYLLSIAEESQWGSLALLDALLPPARSMGKIEQVNNLEQRMAELDMAGNCLR